MATKVDNEKPEKNNNNFLTAEQVSEYLCIPLRTIHRLSKDGKIRAVKIGKQWRYKKSDIERYSTFGTDFSREPARIPDDFAQPLQEGAGSTERRAYPRINTNFNCQYSINLPPFKNTDGAGIIKNLSAGGVFLINKDGKINEIDIDDPIAMQFVLILDKGQEINVNAKGRVVRKAQDAVGIKFKNIDNEVRNRIMEYIG